ncbi:BolA family transcriptional regulator [Glaciecola sp. KUL10]|uniref:BolA family protein n=1 Tax=Glaciecola sp. (strain KUL10) TaxID=2161813 RepID=UPI000D78A1FE|nr:BolA/IbaG family iron-sulfur metabolism protein [Glaciecola sp. KUL10]GBL06194.1 BolA-like protein [Glaciecola sp. KUL10]
MQIEKIIREKVERTFPNAEYELLNESHMHNVPADSETHFKLTLITDEFAGKRLIQRHRALNELLADELAGGVHALALHTYTPEEFKKKNGMSPDSPNCLGGGKR